MDNIFVFSDESGSWHDPNDIYVRSWIILPEREYEKLVNKVTEIIFSLGCKELKWRIIAGNDRYFEYFNDLLFRVFITVSSPKDINWDQKYRITKNYSKSIQQFDFGRLGFLTNVIKKKIYNDIKNILFLNFYENYHIRNAAERIEQIVKPKDYKLIYRIDPPQMSIDGWRDILFEVSHKKPEFPKSERDVGIQFADIIAGAARSFFAHDDKYEKAKHFLRGIKDKLIDKDFSIPNPNIIFCGEVSESLRQNIEDIWNI